MTDTKFISFYSYKGGSGRSTTCINTILHMISKYEATPESPLILIDADIESAGLTYYFKSESKFTDEFDKSIHTTKLITQADDLFDDGLNTDNIFEKNMNYDSVSEDIKENLRIFLENDGRIGDVNEIFNGVVLHIVEQNMLRIILNAHLDSLTPEKMNEKKQRLLSRYMIGNLVMRLSEANSKFNDIDKLKVEKRKIIVDFLPAYSFRDISEYFGAYPGTVRFLGVDVNYSGALSIPARATEAFQKLRKSCQANNVCAVVFDSSAGTQCTAHMLHSFSDVIVYCMRPSYQFIKGTLMQLSKYEPMLIEGSRMKNSSSGSKKMVILLPTAVPEENDYGLGKKSFSSIDIIARDYSDIVDGTFCSRETALNEVNLFKWREYILGVNNTVSDGADTGNDILERFRDPDRMPKDARQAYYVYKNLADRIAENSGGD